MAQIIKMEFEEEENTSQIAFLHRLLRILSVAEKSVMIDQNKMEEGTNKIKHFYPGHASCKQCKILVF